MLTREDILYQISNHASELKKFGVVEIGLYGSYGKNLQKSDSDIDLLINFSNGKETFDNYMRIYDFLENLFNGKKVDVATKNGLSRHIAPIILDEIIYAEIR